MKTWFILIAAILSTQTAALAQGIGVVLVGNDSVDNNGSSLAPFSYSGSRYQQIYIGTRIPGPELGYSGLWISNIAFRVDAGGPGVVGTYSSVQINLSTTQMQPNSLSPVFANNVGLNDTPVFAGSWSGLLPWPGVGFDLRFNFSQGFFYDPSAGNLLLDIRMLGNGINPTRLDALQGATQVSTSVFALDGTALSGTPADLGLVTRIEGQLVPIPEPSTYSLFVLGAGVFLFLRRLRR